MPHSKVGDWLKANPEISEFEKGKNSLSGNMNGWSFYYRTQQALKSIPRAISPHAKIAKSSEVSGKVVICEGARVLPGAFIEGPVFIGKNVIIGNGALVRPGSFFSHDSIVGNHCYATGALFGPFAGAYHFCGVSRSVLKSNSRLSAFVVTATTRPDLEPIITVSVDDDQIELKKIGSWIGSNTFIGAHVTIDPRIEIGDDCLIGPHVHVTNDLGIGKRLQNNYDYELTDNQIKTEKAPAVPNLEYEE